MYTPPAFAETRVDIMHELMRAHPFAALVTVSSEGLMATHIPLVLHAEGSEFGVLRGHMARANSQWSERIESTDALVIFSGPHQYISPSWYPTRQEDGRVVPTWNYAVVHAYGPLTLHHDMAWLLPHLNSLVTQHEAKFERPWSVADAPADYIEHQTGGIVGIEIAIRRLEGKWKLSQNRSDRDRQGVIGGLAKQDTAESAAMRTLMSERT
jgi:transcriptional regulator